MNCRRLLNFGLCFLIFFSASWARAEQESQYAVSEATVFKWPGFTFKSCTNTGKEVGLCITWLRSNAYIIDCDKDPHCAKLRNTKDEKRRRHKNPDYKHIHYRYNVIINGVKYVREGDGWVEKAKLRSLRPVKSVHSTQPVVCTDCQKKTEIETKLAKLTDETADIAETVDVPDETTIDGTPLCGKVGTSGILVPGNMHSGTGAAPVSIGLKPVSVLVRAATKKRPAKYGTKCEVSLPKGCGSRNDNHVEREYNLAEDLLAYGKQNHDAKGSEKVCAAAMHMFNANCGLNAAERSRYNRFEHMVRQTEEVTSEIPNKSGHLSPALLQCIFLVEDPAFEPDAINYYACENKGRHRTKNNFFMAGWKSSAYGLGQVTRDTMKGLIALKDPRQVKAALRGWNIKGVRALFNLPDLTEDERVDIKKRDKLSVNDSDYDTLFKLMGEDEKLQIDIAARVLDNKLLATGDNERQGVHNYDSDKHGPNYVAKVRACYNVCTNDDSRDTPSKWECLSGIGKYIKEYKTSKPGPL